jgi:hypothetical protein
MMFSDVFFRVLGSSSICTEERSSQKTCTDKKRSPIEGSGIKVGCRINEYFCEQANRIEAITSVVAHQRLKILRRLHSACTILALSNPTLQCSTGRRMFLWLLACDKAINLYKEHQQPSRE